MCPAGQFDKLSTHITQNIPFSMQNGPKSRNLKCSLQIHVVIFNFLSAKTCTPHFQFTGNSILHRDALHCSISRRMFVMYSIVHTPFHFHTQQEICNPPYPRIITLLRCLHARRDDRSSTWDTKLLSFPTLYVRVQQQSTTNQRKRTDEQKRHCSARIWSVLQLTS